MNLALLDLFIESQSQDWNYLAAPIHQERAIALWWIIPGGSGSLLCRGIATDKPCAESEDKNVIQCPLGVCETLQTHSASDPEWAANDLRLFLREEPTVPVSRCKIRTSAFEEPWVRRVIIILNCQCPRGDSMQAFDVRGLGGQESGNPKKLPSKTNQLGKCIQETWKGLKIFLRQVSYIGRWFWELKGEIDAGKRAAASVWIWLMNHFSWLWRSRCRVGINILHLE